MAMKTNTKNMARNHFRYEQLCALITSLEKCTPDDREIGLFAPHLQIIAPPRKNIRTKSNVRLRISGQQKSTVARAILLQAH